MSMVAIYFLPCCKREIAYGRFLTKEGMKHPDTTCPLCFKKVSISPSRMADEKIENIPSIKKYIIPKKEEKQVDLLF